MLKKANCKKIIKYLSGSFLKAGMWDEKCYLFRRMINYVSEEQALKFISTIYKRVTDKSKSNIFLISINIVKNGCQFIELLELLGQRFKYMRNRV